MEQLTDNNLRAVILRLANPKEYRGEPSLISKALRKLNMFLMIEGLKVDLEGVNPVIKEVEPDFAKPQTTQERELRPISPPNFETLCLESGLGHIMRNRWEETQKCFETGAYLAATILMGSMMEGLLLAVFQRYPKESNQSKMVPLNHKTGKPKYFAEWTLSEMINVAHDCSWIDLDVKKFSHALRDFRNLIHPYQQMTERTFPDKDTCNISWLVVQAAISDLSNHLK